MRKYLLGLLLLSCSFIADGQISISQGLNLSGQWTNWQNPPKNKPNFASDSQITGGGVYLIPKTTRRYHTTFYIDTLSGADTTSGNYNFFFTCGPSSNPSQSRWGGVVPVKPDTVMTYTYGGSAGSNQMYVNDGSWYTVNFEDRGYYDTKAVFMETKSKPVTIDSVVQMTPHVKEYTNAYIGVYLSDTPMYEEKIYLRFTTNNWASSLVAYVNIDQDTGAAYIPGCAAGTVVQYYVFSSTRDNIINDYDLYTLNFNNNNGANYKYITQSSVLYTDSLIGKTLCPGSSIDIPFVSYDKYNSGNKFTIQLSDSAGSFSSPVNIGYLKSPNPDTVACTIPANCIPSKYYRVRVIANNPVDTGYDNGVNLELNAKLAPKVFASGKTNICQGDSIKLSEISYTGKIYQWTLNGNYIIGATDSFCYVSASGIYKVIISDACNKDSSNAISVSSITIPTVQIQSLNGNTICLGDSIKLSGNQPSGTNVQWFNNGTSINGQTDTLYYAKSVSSYYMIATASNGCQSVSNTITITQQSGCSNIYVAEGINMPGQWSNWSNPPTQKNWASKLQAGGNITLLSLGAKRYHTTFYIDSKSGADTSAGSYDFLFTSGPSANYNQNQWANTNVIMDSLQDYTYSSTTNNNISVTDGNWYTMNFMDKGYNNTKAIFMETPSLPVTIDSVWQTPINVYNNNAVNIGIKTNKTPSGNEYFYIRYSNNKWKTSMISAVKMNNNMGTAIIPPHSSGDTVLYYAFSSTKINVYNYYEMYSINVNDNNGANYNYIVKPQFITTDAISTTTFCSGDKVNITFKSGQFNGTNTYTVQLSDAKGSFGSPVKLSTLNDSFPANINVQIPISTVAGTGYRIRVVGSSPAINGGDNGTDLTINPAPNPIVNKSGKVSFCTGDSVILSVTLKSGETVQWKKNGNVISGATSASIIAKTTGDYLAEVSNSACTTSSSAVQVAVNNVAPSASITAQGNTTFCQGGLVALKATTGAGWSYQWRFNGNNLNGATDSIYSAKVSGSYDLVVTNGCGSSTSSTVSVTVNSKPTSTITANGSTTLCAGKTVDLIGPSSAGFSYQWLKDGSMITGANLDTLTANSSGIYQLVLSNGIGCTDTSKGITVTINTLPNASISGSGPFIFCSGGQVILSVPNAVGNTYVWKKDGVVISSATSNSLLVTVGAQYEIDVTNSGGCTNKQAKTITVFPSLAKPSITTDIPNKKLTSSAAANYQWFLNGSALTGATNQTYIYNQLGIYKVHITDSNGCNAKSLDIDLAKVSINEIGSDLFFELFPNPNAGIFTLQTDKQNIMIEIFDLTGKSMLSYQLKQHIEEINCSNFPKGCYIIKLKDNNNIICKKLIIQ